VNRAVAAAHWLDPDGPDQAAVRLARRLAETLDDLASPTNTTLFGNPGDRSGRVAYVAQTLVGVLRALHLTPEARAGAGIPAEAEGNPLHELRDLTAGILAGDVTLGPGFGPTADRDPAD
jgi:hypothetical protein